MISGFNVFPKGKTLKPLISLKVSMIVQLEFGIAYYAVAVQHISHYATKTPSWFYIMRDRQKRYLIINYFF